MVIEKYRLYHIQCSNWLRVHLIGPSNRRAVPMSIISAVCMDALCCRAEPVHQFDARLSGTLNLHWYVFVSLWPGWELQLACLCAVSHQIRQTSAEVVIASPPKNVLALSGSHAVLDCPTQSPYDELFAWRFFGSNPIGQTVYCVPPYTSFSSDRFQRVGSFGLSISSIRWNDGGTYACMFLRGDVNGLIGVTVVGK